MITRLVFYAAVVSILISGVSAQGYSIRIHSNSNLRAEASLSAAIVETASAGTVLHVSGGFGRWLSISRSGGIVWMADWIGYTRVDSGAQPQSQSPVDNCCFVDRQCQSEQDWVDGYWAFQNGQCSAPAQSQPPASQPASNLTSAVDNCCHLDWQCNTDGEWQNGFFAYQKGQCNHPGIAVVGSQKFVSMMNRVFKMLKTGARQWYEYVVNSGLLRIQMNPPGQTGFGPSDFHYGQGFDDSYDLDDFYYIAIAGILAHESCHAHQWRASIFQSRPQWQSERECVEVQLAVHQALDPICRECDWYRDIIANAQDPEYWWW